MAADEKNAGNGTLYVVATPIGNLEDITMRALRVLREVDCIACEDLRVSRRLLNHYQIGKRLLSCRAANERASAQGLIKLLQKGQKIAYLTDAGTPGISDPGATLVRLVRQSGVYVIPIPGPSALTCLLSVAGTSIDVFFAGFLPQRGRKRELRLRGLLEMPSAVVVYESPYRVVKFLENILSLDPGRNIFVGKEMTKYFEWYACGTPTNLLEKIGNQVKLRGEFAFLLHPNKYCPLI